MPFWRKLLKVPKLRKLFRTLRFRLASGFILLMAVVLVLVAVFGTSLLRTILANQSEETLHEELGALRGWIKFEGGQPYWFVDRTLPEEEAEVSRLEDIYVIANDQGTLALGSADDPSLLKELADPKTIRTELAQIEGTKQPLIKTLKRGRAEYQIIASTMTDPDTGRKWYVAEGRSLAQDQQTLRKFRVNLLIFLSAALFTCTLVGWYSAGRGLRSLQAVDQAAQEITGSNLGLQIAKRGAGDELDRLIDSFNQMSGRLQASFEQMRQFSTDVSHELRTPLTAIQGQLEVALFTATRKEQLQEAIENALQDVERLSNLVRALLLLSQSESGQIPMNKSVIDLSKLLTDIVDQFQIPAEAADVKLSHATREAVLCEADRTQIERVISNLLSNAIKYTPAGGWVRAFAENNGANVRLVVEDSGVGIPQDHLPHIFDRFYRVPDPNPEKGLGLGLSFVSAIVKAHGGEIHVVSHVGTGSRFEVVLPARLVDVAVENPVLSA